MFLAVIPVFVGGGEKKMRQDVKNLFEQIPFWPKIEGHDDFDSQHSGVLLKPIQYNLLGDCLRVHVKQRT